MNAERTLPLGRGKIGFTVSNDYAVPAATVWDAISQAKHVQKFFVDKVTGDFGPDCEPVEWYWKQWGRFTLWPTRCRKGQVLEFLWEDHTKTYLTMVTFTLKKKGKLVELQIQERGWKQAHLKNAFANCEGWTTFLAYLKAYVTNNVVLRRPNR
jgi:uncharacterized protein YndB with AHSA1/START domain